MTNSPSFIFDTSDNTYYCVGAFTTLYIGALLNPSLEINPPSQQSITISGGKLTHFDSAGALALVLWIEQLKSKGHEIELTGFDDKYLDIINLVKEKRAEFQKPQQIAPSKSKLNFLEFIGQQTFFKLEQMQGLLILVGALTDKFINAAYNFKKLHFSSIVSNIYTTGLQALPILALLSFLIGVVLAYQMGLQLETFGVTSFIAYLAGMACLREFAPLVTAIIVAGRTSSAFTAQIGSMKVNEEIDALETMGLSPVELLVLPKVLGLLFVFPLLIFWADIFSIAGAMYMSKLRLDVSYIEFARRLQDSIQVKQVLLGLYKAPAFAILIALVGCFQGFQVESSAVSVGHQTTKSVVQALFLIIITDAIYSILYSWLHI